MNTHSTTIQAVIRLALNAPLLFLIGGIVLADAPIKPAIQMSLTAEKKTVTRDAQGQEQTQWSRLTAKQSSVQAGDILRYTVQIDNQGKKPVRNFVLTEPVPAGMAYVAHSADAAGGVETTFSADDARSFAAVPQVKVTRADGTTESRPAPTDAYTHLRWRLVRVIAPDAAAQVSYQVKVR